ncbi:hypothetical protein BO94DRAFT_67024 [Aspergillus sclerotioniger CBS 115572]|uniref:Uncharacterized protein n=1 Tax=Aspergillus sclerotioniger CBS 115572 TaxID=1450535 RepID=A0A317WKR8_9EURO|nr:hypothetical protein BO94DRAFT_67024 [Aspergillus sclerotioniger CBS 115572]PWY87084.1 hypothetical protein BO94DRAFT_67024 [Aspergillus sclerotioniger CBS 115572]
MTGVQMQITPAELPKLTGSGGGRWLDAELRGKPSDSPAPGEIHSMLNHRAGPTRYTHFVHTSYVWESASAADLGTVDRLADLPYHARTGRFPIRRPLGNKPVSNNTYILYIESQTCRRKPTGTTHKSAMLTCLLLRNCADRRALHGSTQRP